jgi:hypothetical protein
MSQPPSSSFYNPLSGHGRIVFGFPLPLGMGLRAPINRLSAHHFIFRQHFLRKHGSLRQKSVWSLIITVGQSDILKSQPLEKIVGKMLEDQGVSEDILTPFL